MFDFISQYESANKKFESMFPGLFNPAKKVDPPYRGNNPKLPEKQNDSAQDLTVHKQVEEFLYLNAKVAGKEQHNKDFLKKDGKYFKIGGGICECEARVRAFMRILRVGEGTGEYIKGTHQPRNPQLGYTTWFSGSGNNFSDMSNHPQKINHNTTKTVYSSAAGAYQIMGWKYDELNGYDIEKHNGTYRTVIPRKYHAEHDKAKKYDALGFSEISQDRLCIIILDKLDVIKDIISGNIEMALDKSKGVWVSLPGATAGQPTVKMKDTLDYYDEFLKKELSGNSNLHIKPGFLKDFGYVCCDSVSTGCGGKKNVDLRSKMTFYAQSTGSNCTETCKSIVRQLGVYPEGATEISRMNSHHKESYYQLADENAERTKLIFHADEIRDGMDYLDRSLDAGYAVVVGVNHTFKYRRLGIINEDTTDHYVVIVRRYCENNQLYYQFWDVGNKHGDNAEYRFKLTSENHLISVKNYRSDGHQYTVTQIRRNNKK
jgi:muramidase (phage lysozyme)